jgi:hypothetical protein
MTTPAWQPGRLYQPGALVTRATAQRVITAELDNGDFEAGDTGWTLDPAFSIVQNETRFSGAWSLTAGAFVGTQYATNDDVTPVIPGRRVHARCRFRRNSGSRAKTWLELRWLNSDGEQIGVSQSNDFGGSDGGKWYLIQLTFGEIVPSEAAYMQLRIRVDKTAESEHTVMYWDSCSWSYSFVPPSVQVPGLLYRAVQSYAGFSGSSEPLWPDEVGESVQDHEVTWEAVVASSVEWEAEPILVAGSTEPDWPTSPGAEVLDGSIAWRATSRRVTDPKAPRSPIVAIAASKIFAADGDIISFSATVNPLDWSSAENAGYLPFGLQTYGATEVAAMGLYRGNLVGLNAQGFQMWQVDQDPASMALLDAMPIGCTYHKTLQPVAGDLAFLTNLGVRSFGVAAASTNLQAGDFGKQIDPLVRAAIRSAVEPFGLTHPSQGQYWLFFGAEAFVLTINGRDMSWSRYVFPEQITDWTVLGEDLYLRTASDKVWRVDEEALADDVGGEVAEGVPFDGYIAWPYLELGGMGVSKMMHGFDLVGEGEVAVSFGFDQSNHALATPEYTVTAETLTGGVIPMPISGPSFQLRLRFPGGQAWRWESAVIYLQDLRVQS